MLLPKDGRRKQFLIMGAALSAIAALGVLVWFLVGLAFPGVDSLQELHVEPVGDLQDVFVGAHEVVILLRNESNVHLRVTGPELTCGKYCCMRPTRDRVVTIAPKSFQRLEYVLDVREPGHFTCGLSLYIEGNVLRETEVTFSGTAKVK